MKRELLILCVFSIIFFSCKKEDPEPQVSISPQSLDILDVNSNQEFTANIPVSWSFSNPDQGAIDPNGLFSASDSVGRFHIIATSQTDETNQDTIEIRVSNRADILNNLLQGGYVIYLRHAIADIGGDLFDIVPNWHLSCNSDTVRQLSPSGIVQAEQLGEAFKNIGIPLADTIYSSEFCRCIGTAELLNISENIITEEAITYYVYGENERHQKTKTFIDGLNPGNNNILLTSHSFGPGADYPQVSQGYAAIFRPQSGPEFITIIRDDEFILLK